MKMQFFKNSNITPFIVFSVTYPIVLLEFVD